MLGKTEIKTNKPRDGRHCDLCGCSSPAVRCDKCNSQIFCLSCDDMYHRHPKRRFHLRKAVDPVPVTQARPVLPMKISNFTLAGDPSKMPLPPPRKKKPGKFFFSPFRRSSPSSDSSPSLPKKEYSWSDKMGSIKKFMSNRPLPPVPLDDSENEISSSPAKHDLSFIHKRVDEKPPQLPSRSQMKSQFQEASEQSNVENITKINNIATKQQEQDFTPFRNQMNKEQAQNGNEHILNGNVSSFNHTQNITAEERNQQFLNSFQNTGNQFPYPLAQNHNFSTQGAMDFQGFATLQRNFQGTEANTPTRMSLEKQFGSMHQSASATDLQALTTSPPATAPHGMPQYPHLPFMGPPHMFPHYPYPMYSQYPNYPQCFGKSWVNLSSAAPTEDGDLSDQSESSSNPPEGRKIRKGKNAKRSQSVFVDRMAYPGPFYPYGPFPTDFRASPWFQSSPFEAPPSPAGSLRSLNRTGRTRRRRRKIDDDDDDFSMSSSPLSRAKSSSLEKFENKKSFRKEAKSDSSSSCEESDSETQPSHLHKQSVHYDKKKLKEHVQRRRTSSPLQSSITSKIVLNSKKEFLSDEKLSEANLNVTKNESDQMKHERSDEHESGEKSKKSIWVPSSKWQCQYCTFINDAGKRICQVCCKTATKDCLLQNQESEKTGNSNTEQLEKVENIGQKSQNEGEKHDIATLNSALDEAEKEITRGIEELMKINSESLSNGSETVTKSQGRVSFTDVSNLKTGCQKINSDTRLNNVAEVENHFSSSQNNISKTESVEQQQNQLNRQFSVPSSTAQTVLSTSTVITTSISTPVTITTTTNEVQTETFSSSNKLYETDVNVSNVKMYASNSEPQANTSEKVTHISSPVVSEQNPLTVKEKILISSLSRKDSSCQTQQDATPMYVQENVTNDMTSLNIDSQQSLKNPIHVPYNRYADVMSPTQANIFNPQERFLSSRLGFMQRSSSQATLLGNLLNDSGIGAYENGSSSFRQPIMSRSLSRPSLGYDSSEIWASDIHGLRKPDFYLSMEELVERRRQETMRAQGLELVRMIREAEQQGFTADDIQAALNNCGKQNPVIWLQQNWKNMIDTVVTLSTNYGNDKKENDIGTVSVIEAQDALRLHKGNIWAAVTECVEGRQRKFLELSARGKFSRQEISDALSSSEGDVELAYSKLTKTSLKPFLMRIWGSGEGAQNQAGALPKTQISDNYDSDTDDIYRRDFNDNSEDEDYNQVGWDRDFNDEDEDGSSWEGNEAENVEELSDINKSIDIDDSFMEARSKSGTLKSDICKIQTPESDKSDYCDAFGSGLDDYNLCSSIDEIYLIGVEDETYNLTDEISKKSSNKNKSTGFLSKLAALRKESKSDMNYEKSEENNETNSALEFPDNKLSKIDDVKKESPKSFNPLGILKQTFTAIKETVNGVATKKDKNGAYSVTDKRTIIVSDESSLSSYDKTVYPLSYKSVDENESVSLKSCNVGDRESIKQATNENAENEYNFTSEKQEEVETDKEKFNPSLFISDKKFIMNTNKPSTEKSITRLSGISENESLNAKFQPSSYTFEKDNSQQRKNLSNPEENSSLSSQSNAFYTTTKSESIHNDKPKSLPPGNFSKNIRELHLDKEEYKSYHQIVEDRPEENGHNKSVNYNSDNGSSNNSYKNKDNLNYSSYDQRQKLSEDLLKDDYSTSQFNAKLTHSQVLLSTAEGENFMNDSKEHFHDKNNVSDKSLLFNKTDLSDKPKKFQQIRTDTITDVKNNAVKNKQSSFIADANASNMYDISSDAVKQKQDGFQFDSHSVSFKKPVEKITLTHINNTNLEFDNKSIGDITSDEIVESSSQENSHNLSEESTSKNMSDEFNVKEILNISSKEVAKNKNSSINKNLSEQTNSALHSIRISPDLKNTDKHNESNINSSISVAISNENLNVIQPLNYLTELENVETFDSIQENEESPEFITTEIENNIDNNTSRLVSNENQGKPLDEGNNLNYIDDASAESQNVTSGSSVKENMHQESSAENILKNSIDIANNKALDTNHSNFIVSSISCQARDDVKLSSEPDVLNKLSNGTQILVDSKCDESDAGTQGQPKESEINVCSTTTTTTSCSELKPDISDNLNSDNLATDANIEKKVSFKKFENYNLSESVSKDFDNDNIKDMQLKISGSTIASQRKKKLKYSSESQTHKKKSNLKSDDELTVKDKFEPASHIDVQELKESNVKSNDNLQSQNVSEFQSDIQIPENLVNSLQIKNTPELNNSSQLPEELNKDIVIKKELNLSAGADLQQDVGSETSFNSANESNSILSQHTKTVENNEHIKSESDSLANMKLEIKEESKFHDSETIQGESSSNSQEQLKKKKFKADSDWLLKKSDLKPRSKLWTPKYKTGPEKDLSSKTSTSASSYAENQANASSVDDETGISVNDSIKMNLVSTVENSLELNEAQKSPSSEKLQSVLPNTAESTSDHTGMQVDNSSFHDKTNSPGDNTKRNLVESTAKSSELSEAQGEQSSTKNSQTLLNMTESINDNTDEQMDVSSIHNKNSNSVSDNITSDLSESTIKDSELIEAHGPLLQADSSISTSDELPDSSAELSENGISENKFFSALSTKKAVNDQITSVKEDNIQNLSSSIRPHSPFRRMSFNSRKEAIFLERKKDLDFNKIFDDKSYLQKDIFIPKQIIPKRSIKQQLEFERKVRKLVSDRKCRTYRKAEIVVQLTEMNFEEEEAIQAANECTSLEKAISYLQQECLLCAGKYPVGEINSMMHCSHKACKECLKAYFTIQIRDRTIMDMLCPFCNEPDIRDEDIAQDYFNHLDIMLKKLVEPDIHELFQRKLRDRVLMKDPNFRWCSQCSSGFIAEPRLKKLMCPDCNAITCAKCRRVWEREHEGVSCEAFTAWKDANDPEAQAAGLAKILIENGIDCPSCHFRYALAKGGCMHFRCIQCHHDFCSGCSKPFKMGQKCGVSEFCVKLGLHAHHPRNCLFYLRDKEPEDLQKLLDMNDVKYDKDPPPGMEVKNVCQVMEQKETPQGMVDDICGKEVEQGYAGLCRLHYVEYLGQLVNKCMIDPIQIFENDDLELVLKRASIRLPAKKYRESDFEYREKLVKLIKDELPLDKIDGS